MKKIIAFIIAFCLAIGVMPVCLAYEKEMPEMTDYGLVDCGDVKIEYGVYGNPDGEALLLLPPNGGDMHCFDNSILPEMAKHFRVITVSPRGTGNSGWVDGTMNFETFADDVATVLDYLKIEKTHIFGFSDGGNLGFVFTLKYLLCCNELDSPAFLIRKLTNSYEAWTSVLAQEDQTTACKKPKAFLKSFLLTEA